MNPERVDLLIVGAGLSGLMAAHTVRDAGLSVVLVDKGRGFGGRLATRRLGDGLADHGAQFFTVRDPVFGRLVEAWLADGLVFEWSRGWSSGSLDHAPSDGYPRYAVKGGFTTLAKHLSVALDVRLATEVETVAESEGGWGVSSRQGAMWQAKSVLLTPPVPQSLALLDRGGLSLAEQDQAALAAVAYAPCLCGLFLLSGATTLPAPGALQQPDQPVSWIADNQRKGISPGAVTVTVHANPEESEARWQDDPDAILAWLTEALHPHLALQTVIETAQLKRWRYALPTQLHPERFLRAAVLPPLFFAGDAFGGPRVEGAALSGLAAGAALVKLLAGELAG